VRGIGITTKVVAFLVKKLEGLKVRKLEGLKADGIDPAGTHRQLTPLKWLGTTFSTSNGGEEDLSSPQDPNDRLRHV
jgi:hypothetical protein